MSDGILNQEEVIKRFLEYHEPRQINVEKLLYRMNERIQRLNEQIQRDFGGNMVGRLEAMRECKYWKEAIERGEFDV